MSITRREQWVTSIAIPIVLFLIIFIIGPIVVGFSVLLQRFALCRVPPWDPDRYWDSIKGYAFVAIAVYAILVLRIALFGPGGQLDLGVTHMACRLLMEGLDLASPALLFKWAAGLLLLPALDLLQERSSPRTDRTLYRILTPNERQTLAEREQKEVHPEATGNAEPGITRKAPARRPTAKRLPEGPINPPQQGNPVQREQLPDDANSRQPAHEEQERNQFLKDEAQKMNLLPPTPATPKPRQPKVDKGDGSMDELL